MVSHMNNRVCECTCPARVIYIRNPHTRNVGGEVKLNPPHNPYPLFHSTPLHLSIRIRHDLVQPHARASQTTHADSRRHQHERHRPQRHITMAHAEARNGLFRTRDQAPTTTIHLSL